VGRASETATPVHLVYTGDVFQFDITNVISTNFTVVAATNIALALSNWTEVDPPISIGEGVLRFTHTAATNYPQR
jgi:hypothetical protein